MPFERQPLSQLRAQTAADLAAAVPGANPLLPNSNLGILGDLVAETLNSAYGYLDYIARQSVPFTAVDEAFEGWAALKGVTRKSAVAATGRGTWQGAPGSLLPALTPVSSGAIGYVTLADGIVGGDGAVTVDLEATVTGAAGTLIDGASLVLGQALPGIGSTGVAASTTPGVDVEAFADFRTRVLAIYADPPQGGSIADYRKWALDVPGVTRAWCAPNGQGPGTVVVYVMLDVAEKDHNGFPQGDNGVASAETRDIPATGDQLVVADYIFPLRPVTALVYVFAPLPNTVTFVISLPGVTNNQKAAVSAAIDATFLAYGEPGGAVELSRIGAAIAAISGTAGFVITDIDCDHGAVAPGASGNIASDAGYLPVRGLITWV